MPLCLLALQTREGDLEPIASESSSISSPSSEMSRKVKELRSTSDTKKLQEQAVLEVAENLGRDNGLDVVQEQEVHSFLIIL